MSFAEKSVLLPSLGPSNPPAGLYALILTAVSRHHYPQLVFCLIHLTGRARVESPYDRHFQHAEQFQSLLDVELNAGLL